MTKIQTNQKSSIGKRCFNDLLLSLVVGLCLTASPTFAQTDAPVFGPEKFFRKTGAPKKIDRIFKVNDLAGPFKILIQNGDGRAGQVSSAVISLNGEKVASPEDFSSQGDTISKPTALKYQNELSVELRSSPGSFVTITILGPASSIKDKIAALEDQGVIPKLDRSKDLAGPDTNQNGIRDDVEAQVDKMPITQEQRLAVYQLARSFQTAMIVDVTDKNLTRQASEKNDRATNCLVARFPGPENILKAKKIHDLVERLTANTKERTMQYIKFNKSLSGIVSTSPRGNSCDN